LQDLVGGRYLDIKILPLKIVGRRFARRLLARHPHVLGQLAGAAEPSHASRMICGAIGMDRNVRCSLTMFLAADSTGPLPIGRPRAMKSA